MENPKFVTLKSFSVDFGTRNFLEVALKEAREGDKSNKFISISKGFTDAEGGKHYKRSLGFGLEIDVLDFLIEHLPELREEAMKAKEESTEEESEEE